MTPADFFATTSLYEALIVHWTLVGADVVAELEIAQFNQPSFDPDHDSDCREVTLIFRGARPLNPETAAFQVPAFGDARVIDQESSVDPATGAADLELTCEVEQYPTAETAGASDYISLRLGFNAVDILEAA